MPHVGQELLTLPEHQFLVGFVLRGRVLCVVFCRSLFLLLHLAIVLSVLLRSTGSDYTFSIFLLFMLIYLEMLYLINA